jgi:hypothetical protein
MRVLDPHTGEPTTIRGLYYSVSDGARACAQ